jgi:hypothetical protein
MYLRKLLLILLILMVGGCSGRPSRIAPVAIDPSKVASNAMDQLDANLDGQLTEQELAGAPSLLAARAELDKDGNGSISSQEIADRVKFWQDSRMAILPAKCQILTKDGRPLAGATVVLEPELFLGGAIHPAFGTTGNNGIAMVSVADENKLSPEFSGLSCGFYRVKVSLKSQGRETIGERFNETTILGTEISPNAVPYYAFHVTRD